MIPGYKKVGTLCKRVRGQGRDFKTPKGFILKKGTTLGPHLFGAPQLAIDTGIGTFFRRNVVDPHTPPKTP